MDHNKSINRKPLLGTRFFFVDQLVFKTTGRSSCQRSPRTCQMNLKGGVIFCGDGSEQGSLHYQPKTLHYEKEILQMWFIIHLRQVWSPGKNWAISMICGEIRQASKRNTKHLRTAKNPSSDHEIKVHQAFIFPRWSEKLNHGKSHDKCMIRAYHKAMMTCGVNIITSLSTIIMNST